MRRAAFQSRDGSTSARRRRPLWATLYHGVSEGRRAILEGSITILVGLALLTIAFIT